MGYVKIGDGVQGDILLIFDHYKIIDVSQWMDEFCFPGNPSFSRQGPFNRVQGTNREFVYDMEICSQSGTHIQGPHYFMKEGKTIDEFPLNRFEGFALMMDLEKRGTDTTAQDFKEKFTALETETESKTSGDILILRTGNMEHIIQSGTIDANQRPGLSMDAAVYLAEERKIKLIGIDSIGLESRSTQNYEINRYLCSKEVLILEGLVNLHSVTSRTFFIEAYPLKIKGVEGTPCRAIIKEPIETKKENQ